MSATATGMPMTAHPSAFRGSATRCVLCTKRVGEASGADRIDDDDVSFRCITRKLVLPATERVNFVTGSGALRAQCHNV